MLAAYTVNQEFVNPYTIWLSQGKPDYPTRSQLQEIRNHEVRFVLSDDLSYIK